jgi:hypothetical protein
MMKKVALAVMTAAAVLSLPASANASSIILNGSFENNTAGATAFNISNATFNTTVASATAFGTAQEIDLVTGASFGITPQNGSWKLGLHTQGGGAFDAFSMSLSSGLVAGQSYSLSFYGALQQGQPPGTLQIGVSSSANGFGDLVFIATPFFTSQWELFTTTFIAPSNGAFLTVRTNPFEGYAFVDNFSLEAAAAVPEPATMTLLAVGLGIGLAAGGRRRLRAGRRVEGN